jgi:Rft protein
MGFGNFAVSPKASDCTEADGAVSRRTSRFNVDHRLAKLSMTMTGQSVIKHVLTEGDKMVLSFFSPLEDQGGYAIALNYGWSSYLALVWSLTGIF